MNNQELNDSIYKPQAPMLNPNAFILIPVRASESKKERQCK